MSKSKKFIILELEPRLLYEHDDGNFNTLIFGFTPNSRLEIPDGYTHFGVILNGAITLSYQDRDRRLSNGDFFSVIGPAFIQSEGFGMISSAKTYKGLNLFGGPLEEKGRLRYIDGCTDTLLIQPVRKGNPCLNHLHFPPQITQTPHTHPSVRTGVVYKGAGECLIPENDKPLPLIEGYAFVIETEAVHSFNTKESSMDIIAFHPDSDTGMTDDDHPMINRTIVDGVSAKFHPDIRT